MFDFFRPRTAKEFMEEAKEKYTVPPLEPPERPAQTVYRIGITNNNRVSIQMGYTEVTMNRQGIDNFIKQLEVFRDQLEKECDDDLDQSQH